MSRGTVTLLLLAILAASGLAASVRLGEEGPRTWHEAVALRSSHETWRRGHDGVERAWVVPYLGDEPRFAKPPMIVWLNLAAWRGLDPDTVNTGTLVLRSRLVGLLLGGLTLVGVFVAGTAVLDARLGLLGAAVAGTTPFLQTFARMATYDIGLLAGTTIAIGAALVALRPDATPRRRIAGWVVASAALAFAWMCKGPLSAVVFVLAAAPTAIVWARGGARRSMVAALAGVAACVVAAALLVAPWYLELDRVAVGLGERLGREYSGPDWDRRPPWYYLYHVHWTLPWTIWLVAGWFHPFVRAAGAARRRRLAPWLWGAATLLFFSIVPQKVPRYVLPVVPALALVSAVVWRDHIESAARGQPDAGSRPLLHAHWAACAVASAVAAAWLVVPALVATAAAAVGWRLHARGRVAGAAAAAFTWSAVASGSFWQLDAPRHADGDAIRAAAARVRGAVTDGRVLALYPRRRDRIACTFELEANLVVRTVLPHRLAEHAGAFVISFDEGEAAALRDHAAELVLDGAACAPLPHGLWRLPPPGRPRAR